MARCKLALSLITAQLWRWQRLCRPHLLTLRLPRPTRMSQNSTLPSAAVVAKKLHSRTALPSSVGCRQWGGSPVSAPCGSSHLACVTSTARPHTQQAALPPLLLLQTAAARQPAALAALTMPPAAMAKPAQSAPAAAPSCWLSLPGMQLTACRLVAASLSLTLSYG